MFYFRSVLNSTIATQKFVSDSINDLQNAVKCATSQLSGGNLTGNKFTSLTVLKIE